MEVVALSRESGYLQKVLLSEAGEEANGSEKCHYPEWLKWSIQIGQLAGARNLDRAVCFFRDSSVDGVSSSPMDGRKLHYLKPGTRAEQALQQLQHMDE